MDPEQVRSLLKKWAIIASFFVVALLFFVLRWRAMLMAYVLIVGITSVAAVLIQSGRGGGLAASLGGVGGDSLFGARSATPIAKATYVMLALFIVLCLLIAKLGFMEPPPGAALAAPPMGQPVQAPAAPVPGAPVSEAPLPGDADD